MPSVYLVRIRYETREERLCLLEGTAASEISEILAGLFQIPADKRVVGITGGATGGAVVIPLLAMCKYPDLIFREVAKLGHVFRIVTKEADRESEILYPISALTPPPPPGCSDLPPRWEIGPASVSSASTLIILPELLVSSGALTRQQGKTVAKLVSVEDPVVFAAFRIAGVTAVEGAYDSSLGAYPGGSFSGGMWGWNSEVLRSLSSVLKAVVADRETGRVGHRGQSNYGKGGERGGGKGQAAALVPSGFQADIITLADVALVTGKISKTTYVRALHKAVTLDPGLVRAYHADVERQCRREGQDLPKATLRAFREGGAKPPAAGVASGFGGSGMEGISTPFAAAEATASVHQQLPVNSRGGASGASIVDGEGRGGFVEGAAGNVPRTGEAEMRYKLLGQALHWIVEGKVSGGLSAHHKDIVEHAIATEHPWVSAIYEECKETGDVRGLVLNLQRLPALLERDRAAGFAADVSQPPPPGETDPPFWSPPPSQPTRRERREVHQHQREDMRLTGEAVAGTRSEYPRLSEALAKTVQEAPAYSIAPPGQTGENIGNNIVNVTDSATIYTDGNSKISNLGVDSGSESMTISREVMAQLGRVITGCSKLLRLRGAIGELEARALDVMSRRGSPVLLAAVEAYGVNQDLEHLFDILTTAAKAELSVSLGLSVSLEPKDVDGKKESSPRPIQALRHQFPPQQQQQQQQQQQRESRESCATEARIVHVEEAFSRRLEMLNCYTSDGAGANANTAGNAFSTRLQTEGRKNMLNSETVNAAPYSITRNAACCSIDSGFSRGSAAAANNTKVSDGDIGEISNASPAPCLETSRESTMRRSASAARAQELLTARFAGMRSAAEARAKTSGAATTGAAEVEGKVPGGDKKLRQDVSRLIGVMDKNGMLTDRQRVYLLAQVGRRITERARECHTRYLESGNSKELYAVLMELSAPKSSPRDGEEETSDDDVDSDEERVADKEG